MSPFDVNRLTLNQAIYYLEEHGSKSVSRSDLLELQNSMSQDEIDKARRKLQERIAYYSGQGTNDGLQS